MKLTDAVKLLYQSEFGPGHMIPDESASLQRLYEEWENTSHSSSGPFSEAIGNGLVRIYLDTLKKEELPVAAGKNSYGIWISFPCISPTRKAFFPNTKKWDILLSAIALLTGLPTTLPTGS